MKKKASSKVTAKQQRENERIAYTLELEAEIGKYHEWCLEWRRLNDALEEELKRTQFMLMDAQAVIVYLENKLGVGV